MDIKHKIVIVGGGAAGTTVAALLLRARSDWDIAVIEPSEFHYYQPAWTLVGAGEYSQSQTRRKTADCLPKAVRWIQANAQTFAPEKNQLTLDSGAVVSYEYLVLACGLQLQWGAIIGLADALGKNSVCSNYRYDLAPYTWQSLQNFSAGKALFTQPTLPIKCAGAPQKIMYMAADTFQKRGLNVDIQFLPHAAAMFSVPFYAAALEKVAASYGITTKFGHNLVAVDGPRKLATFETVRDGRKERATIDFDFLHVVPPQGPVDYLKNSPLVDAAGWVTVDKHRLRHTQFANIYALGDCANTPNSKTAAAVRAQAPIVVANMLADMFGDTQVRQYDGYSSCPLTTSKGKIMLAEFGYDGVIMPSFAGDPRVPRSRYWLLKKYYLPHLYWQMLSGNLGWDWHKVRSYPADLPSIKP